MADKEPNWLALSRQEEKPTQVLPGYHWEKTQSGGWQQLEDDAKPMSSRPISDDVSYLRDIQIKRPATVETKASSTSADLTEDSSPTSTKTSVKMPTRPGQQSVVTMDMVKAAGFDNLRDYMNAQQGLVRRKEKTAPKSYENMVKFDSAGFSARPLETSRNLTDFNQRQQDLGKKYAKGGKISLDACGVSTHKPAKKNANW